MSIGQRFPSERREAVDPQTGRRVVLHTTAPCHNYGLYYFVPTITAEGDKLVFHSDRAGSVQLFAMDLADGSFIQLTAAAAEEAGWFIWCDPHLTGVFNHLSALNTERREVYYFEDNRVMATHLDTLANDVVHRLDGRMPIGQSAFSPDGRLFAFIHADAAAFRRAQRDREQRGNAGRFDRSVDHQRWRRGIDCTIGLVDTSSGAYRDVIAPGFHVHHVLFADDRTLLINHQADGMGMWTVDVTGRNARDLRPDVDGFRICHQIVNAAGIDYEAVRRGRDRSENRIGRYNPSNHTCNETPIDLAGYLHTGNDPLGRLIFLEQSADVHRLLHVRRPLDPKRRGVQVIRDLAPCPAPGQRFHAHPTLSPDRRWMFHTSVEDGWPQVAAVDVADFADEPDAWTA